MKTAIATLLALGLLSGTASARTVFDDIRDTAPRSVFTDIQASVSAFKGKKFAVTEKVIAGAGHCAFDGHGEAVGIWTANP